MTRKICETYAVDDFHILIHKIQIDPCNEHPGILDTFGVWEALQEEISPRHGHLHIIHTLVTGADIISWTEWKDELEVRTFQFGKLRFTSKIELLIALKNEGEKGLLDYFMSLLDI